jgi:hypothetical protein
MFKSGFYKQKESNEHLIYIKHSDEYGNIKYSRFPCHDVNVYTQIMEKEFNKKVAK